MVDLAQKHSVFARFFAKVGIGLLALAILGVGGRFAYVRFFPDVLVKRARTAFAKGDLRNAALAAERAYQIRHSDIDAMRLMADIADQAGQYIALEWRKKVVEAQPDSLPDILACASTALHFGQAEVAKETLALAKNTSGSARYWALSASTDAFLGGFADAEREAGEAHRLEPGNQDYQLTLASAQLKTQRLEVRDEARATLEALTKNPQLRMPAERLLIEDSLANGELGVARKLGEVVASDKDSQFYDKLTYLTVLNRSGDERFHRYLESLQVSAASSPSNTGTLIAWMRSVGLNRQAFDWAKSLSPSLAHTPEAGPFISLSYVDAAHWQELHDLIKDASWGKLEYLRHAYLAHAAEMLGNGVEYQLTSNTAMGEAAAQPQAERVLGEMELEWGWQGEAQRTLEHIVATSGNRGYVDWALRHLYKIYQDQGDVGQLAIVTQKIAETSPEDDAIQNNYVMFSLLTRTNLLKVLPLAEALYKRHSADRVFVSTYAYSLLIRGENAEAMKVIMNLSEVDRRSASVAPYCGIILAANKEKETAKTYLDLVDEKKLLPPEAILVDAARKQTR